MHATEEKIIDSAIKILNDNFSASLETIAQDAGLTRRSLHRYFSDRAQLLISCEEVMRNGCRNAIIAAHNSSDDPIAQLESMLYAGIDCGSKYTFFIKSHQGQNRNQLDSTNEVIELDEILVLWKSIIAKLQERKAIDYQMNINWIFALFTGMVNTTVNAFEVGSVAHNDIKSYAWLSFSRSIGLKPTVLNVDQ